MPSSSVGWKPSLRWELLAFGWLVLFAMVGLSPANADVRSTNGTINFDSNFDGVYEAVLNNSGFGISTTTPSAILHVVGNEIVSGAMVVGGTNNASGSNLHINGSYGCSVEIVTGSTTLSGNSVVLADTSAANFILTLPHAGNVLGRLYSIKKISVNNIVQISAGNNFLDGYCYYSLSSGNLGSIKVISNGSKWNVIEKYSGADEAWTPQKIATALWLDASDASASTVLYGATGNVYQWSDKSGQGYHATQSNATYQPKTNVRSLYGKIVLDFTSQQMATNLNIDRTAATNLSVFVVFAQDSTIGSFGLFGADNGGWDRLAVLNFDASSGSKWGISNGGSSTAFEPTRTPDTSNHIYLSQGRQFGENM